MRRCVKAGSNLVARIWQHAACLDTGATAGMASSEAMQCTLTLTQKRDVTMHTADSGTASIDTVGFGTLCVLNTKSQLRVLPTGRNLVGRGKLSDTKVKLHDLVSIGANRKKLLCVAVALGSDDPTSEKEALQGPD